MASVLELQQRVLRESGDENHFEFVRRSKAHQAFWDKLNELGFAPYRGMRPEDYPEAGLNASAQLSDDQCSELIAEFQTL